MELTVNIGYEKLLGLVKQLSFKDKRRLYRDINTQLKNENRAKPEPPKVPEGMELLKQINRAYADGCTEEEMELLENSKLKYREIIKEEWQ